MGPVEVDGVVDDVEPRGRSSAEMHGEVVPTPGRQSKVAGGVGDLDRADVVRVPTDGQEGPWWRQDPQRLGQVDDLPAERLRRARGLPARTNIIACSAMTSSSVGPGGSARAPRASSRMAVARSASPVSRRALESGTASDAAAGAPPFAQQERSCVLERLTRLGVVAAIQVGEPVRRQDFDAAGIVGTDQARAPGEHASPPATGDVPIAWSAAPISASTSGSRIASSSPSPAPSAVREVQGPKVVLGDDLGGPAVDPAGSCRDPGGRREVLRDPSGSRERAIGDVANERVPERVLGLALHGGRKRGSCQFPARQVCECRIEGRRVPRPERRNRARPEGPADDRGIEEDRLEVLRQGIDAGGQEGMDVRRDRRRVELGGLRAGPVPEHGRELLGVERRPAARSRMLARSAGAAPGRAELTSSLTDASGRASSDSTVERRARASQDGCRSSISGRAVTTSVNGSPVLFPARCTRSRTNASSAQCRSSTIRTSRPGARDPLEEATPRREGLVLLRRARPRPRAPRAGRAGPSSTTRRSRSGSIRTASSLADRVG